MHSDCDVGLDSAKTIGRSLIFAISSSTARVNVPPTAATPMMPVGLSVLMAVDEVFDRRVIVGVVELVRRRASRGR